MMDDSYRRVAPAPPAPPPVTPVRCQDCIYYRTDPHNGHCVAVKGSGWFHNLKVDRAMDTAETLGCRAYELNPDIQPLHWLAQWWRNFTDADEKERLERKAKREKDSLKL